MIRSELVTALAARFPHLTTKDAEIAVAEILEGIAKALAHGNRVEIRGFGSFDLNFRAPRRGRNPKTGESVQVAPKYVPHFKAGKALRARVERSAEPLARLKSAA